MLQPAALATAQPAQRRGANWPIGLVFGLLALIVYVVSVSPGLEWGDSGHHQYRILVGHIEHPCGLALSHPLHFRLAQLALAIPYGEPAWRFNMVSAVSGAIAVGALAALILKLTASRLAACAAALVLLVAHTFWQMSSTTETYTLSAAIMIFEWLVLLKYVGAGQPRWLVLLFAVNGLFISNHLLGLLTLATYGVLAVERVWRRKLAPGWLLVCAGVWLVCSSPYWILVLRFYFRTHDLLFTLRSAFFGGGNTYSYGWTGAVLGFNLSAGQLINAFLALGYNFPSLTLLLAVPGLLSVGGKPQKLFRRVLIAQTVLITVFVMRYRIADLYTFFVPVDVLVAFWFGLGVDRIWRGLRTPTGRTKFAAVLAVNAVLPPLVYVAFPVIASQRHLLDGRWQDRPYREEYAYMFRPWRRGDQSAAEFSRDALRRAGPGGWVLGESTTAPTAAYWYLVHGGPPNVEIFSERWSQTSSRPDLTENEVRDFIRAGGNVVVVAGFCTDTVWSPSFRLDKSDRYWWRISTGP